MKRSRLGPSLIPAALVLGLCALGPAGVLHPSPWILAVATVVVMVTQPTPTASQFASPVDRFSAIAILIAGNVGTLTPAVEYTLRQEVRPAPLSWMVWVGALVLALGVALRVWAIQTLDRAFTAVVQTTAEQQLITGGPYRWLRHPSYTGVLIGLVGASLLFESLAGVVAMVGVMLPVYVFRIRIEEQALIARFGEAYREFSARRWALIPPLY